MSGDRRSAEAASEAALTKKPRHVAIIMDGNGRWARERGLPRIAGHRAGTENLRRVLCAAVEFGIPVLTIYAFSTENWTRPPAEVGALLSILEHVLDHEINELHANGVRIRHIGRTEGLPRNLIEKIRYAVDLTQHNDQLVLNVAFNYGGRAELVDAVRQIVAEGVRAEQVNEELIAQHLSTSGLPDPDLVIRTGGDMRLSNYLLWQCAYSELYVTSTYWPDFGREEFLKALVDYQGRQRRFGGLPG